MSAFDALASSASLTLALALAHFLWQGFLIALLAAVAVRFFGRDRE